MEKKFTVLTIAAIALVSLMFAACPTELTLGGGGGETPTWGGGYSGTVTGSGFGFGGSSVGVTLTLVNGYITDVALDLRTQTPAFVGRHPTVIPPIVIRDNSFDNIPVQIISGSTRTTEGIIQAGNAALATIPSVEGEEGTN